MDHIDITRFRGFGDTCKELRPPGAADLWREDADRFSLRGRLGSGMHLGILLAGCWDYILENFKPEQQNNDKKGTNKIVGFTRGSLFRRCKRDRLLCYLVQSLTAFGV